VDTGNKSIVPPGISLNKSVSIIPTSPLKVPSNVPSNVPNKVSSSVSNMASKHVPSRVPSQVNYTVFNDIFQIFKKYFFIRKIGIIAKKQTR